MLTDAARSQTDARNFVLRGGAWSLGFFGLLRLSWIEAHLVLPATHAQGAFAVGLFGTPTLPVEATLACSGYAYGLIVVTGSTSCFKFSRQRWPKWSLRNS